MSTHFKRSLQLLGVVSLLLLALYVWFAVRANRGITTGGPARPLAVLPKNDKEQVTFNAKTHTLIVQTPTQTIKEFAKNPVVEIRKNGDVVIARHLMGWEAEPFFGAGMTLAGPRVFIGDNLLHVGRFDLQAAIGMPFTSQQGFFKLYGGFGYNFYDNTSLNVGVNPLAAAQSIPDVTLFLSIRF